MSLENTFQAVLLELCSLHTKFQNHQFTLLKARRRRKLSIIEMSNDEGGMSNAQSGEPPSKTATGDGQDIRCATKLHLTMLNLTTFAAKLLQKHVMERDGR